MQVAPVQYSPAAQAVQVTPFPLNPGRQVQEDEPMRLVQVAFGLQPPLLVWHSFTSLQRVPSAARA